MKHIILTSIAASSIAASSILFTSCSRKDAAEENTTNSSAIQTVEDWQNNAAEGKISSLWASLPGDYQSDVSELAHSFGGKVDSELYDKGIKTLSSVNNILATKKDIIIEIIKESGQPNQDKIIDSYDSIVGVLNTITESDAKTTDGLQKLDLTDLVNKLEEHTTELAHIASLVNNKNIAKLKDASFELVSESDSSAIVKITSGNDVEEVSLTKAGTHWLPADLVAEWPTKLQEAKDAIDALGTMDPGKKQQIIIGLSFAEGLLNGLQSANTKEEFTEKISGMMSQFGFGF